MVSKFYNNFQLDLRTTGIWVPWSGSKSGVPDYAVVAGYNSNLLYFARAVIKGRNRIGRYQAGEANAYFVSDKEYTASTFEVSCYLTDYRSPGSPSVNHRICVSGDQTPLNHCHSFNEFFHSDFHSHKLQVCLDCRIKY